MFFHKLQHNKGCKQPNSLIFFDTESTVDEYGIHHPYLLCAEFWKKKENICLKITYKNKEMENFWIDVNFFCEERSNVWVYAHNAGYDSLISKAIPELCKLGYKVDNYYEQGLMFILTLKLSENDKIIKTINVLSSTNYYQFSLKKLGDMFGLEKLEYNFQNGLTDEAIEYCQRDVEITRTAIFHFMDFIIENDLGMFSKTIAGQSFRAFRHKFMNKEIFIHKNQEAVKLERQSYFGGRTECFKIGNFNEQIYSYDINSMYPFVMQKNLYPVKLLSYRKRISLDCLQELLDRGYLVCAHVKISTNKAFYPMKFKDNLIFPIGTFDTYLCTPEIKLAIENSHLIQVFECSIYQAGEIFTDYVKFFYDKRLEAKTNNNKIHDTIYKLFLNSLYGKFGQKGEFWERIGDAPIGMIHTSKYKNLETGESGSIRIFGGSMFKKIDGEREAFNSFCAISSHVTSYSRVLLNSLILTAGSKNVMYTDTDSLFVSNEGKMLLENSGVLDETKLGFLKFVKEDKKIQIFAPKDYQFSGEIKQKGIKKNAEQIEPDIYQQEQWLRFNSAINQKNFNIYHTKKVIKKLKREYVKGILIKGETDVLPIKFLNGKMVKYGCEYEYFNEYYKDC